MFDDEDFNPLEELFSSIGAAYRDYGPGTPAARPTRVWRLEMPNGNGPFNSGLPNAHEIYAHICSGRPGLDCDRLEGENGGQCDLSDRAFREATGHSDYGCDSLESLALWFPRRARDYLAGYGVRVVEYEVPAGRPTAACGHGEVLFDRHSSRVVGTHGLDLVDAHDPACAPKQRAAA